MIGRFKYWLLKALLNDICCRSECEKCYLTEKIEICGQEVTACAENDIFLQARKVWGLC